MEAALLIMTVVELAIIAGLCAVGYQVVKQQGRQVLRLDGIERRLELISQGTGTSTQTVPLGLSVGAAMDPFRLPDLHGQPVALEDLHGTRALLVHWNPSCGFCDLIAPDLARLHADLRARDLQLVLVSHGDAGANRTLAEEHGLRCPILLLGDNTTLRAFEHLGTPVAYLLDEHGRVAEPLAIGADQVLALTRSLVAGEAKRTRLPGERPLSLSRIERGGLKAGTRAPAFSLPDVNGRPVSLEAFRGRRVLLVFSDPECGPCDQLAPHLVRLQREHRDNSLAVLLVGRGDPEENRRKAEAAGFAFPVVVQERWKLSREYGIFATPVAFLIDEHGVIAAGVAQGVDEILALARAEPVAAGV